MYREVMRGVLYEGEEVETVAREEDDDTEDAMEDTYISDPLPEKQKPAISASALPPKVWKDIMECFRGTDIEDLLRESTTGLSQTLADYNEASHNRCKQNMQTEEDERIVGRSYMELTRGIDHLRKENNRLKAERNYAVASKIKSQLQSHAQSLSDLPSDEDPVAKFDVSTDGKDKSESRSDALCRELHKFDVNFSKMEPGELEAISGEFARFFQKYRFMLPAVIHKCKQQREDLGLSPYSVFREILMPSDMVEMIASDPRLILDACKKSTIFGSTALMTLLTECPESINSLFETRKDTMFIFKHLFTIATAQEDHSAKNHLKELAKVYLNLEEKGTASEEGCPHCGASTGAFSDIVLAAVDANSAGEEPTQSMAMDYLSRASQKGLLHGRKTILRTLTTSDDKKEKNSPSKRGFRKIINSKVIKVPSFWEGFMKFMKNKKPVICALIVVGGKA